MVLLLLSLILFRFIFVCQAQDDQWTTWSSCTVSCGSGGGIQERSRNCALVSPATCYETRVCNNYACAYDLCSSLSGGLVRTTSTCLVPFQRIVAHETAETQCNQLMALGNRGRLMSTDFNKALPTLVFLHFGSTIWLQAVESPLRNWYWMSNGGQRLVSYKNWASNIDPTNTGANSCLQMSTSTWNFQPQHCISQRAFVCQFEATTNGELTDQQMLYSNLDFRFDNRCIIQSNSIYLCNVFVYSPTVSWYQAQTHCYSRGHRLVEISSDVEKQAFQDRFQSFANLRNFWMGASNRRWLNADGSPLQVFYWTDGQPVASGVGQDCIVASIDNQNWERGWQTESCTRQYQYTCEIEVSPLSSSWTEWSIWNSCNVQCGNGTRSRNRFCQNTIDGSTSTSCLGLNFQEESCSSICAAVWGVWSVWSSCSATCGIASQTRSRLCFNQDGLTSNNCSGDSIQQQTCSLLACSNETSSWNEWGQWSSCSISCGSGVKVRLRSCVQQDGSASADCIGSSSEEKDCLLQDCILSWTLWGSWGECSVTCGEGFRLRERICIGPDGTSSSACSGASLDSSQCSQTACASYQWTIWSEWGGCSVTCDFGQQLRTRQCLTTDGLQSDQCTGVRLEERSCQMGTCVEPAWTPWGLWSTCSTTCGGGLRIRTRVCVYPGFEQSSTLCPGISTDQQDCAMQTCLSAVWSSWSSWSSCSVTCESGVRVRNRTCLLDGQSSLECVGGVFMEQLPCSTGISCVASWTDWTLWSQCSVTCGEGFQMRTRSCLLGSQPAAGCAGNGALQQQNCSVAVACVASWSDWTPWGQCSATCDTGIQTRTRSCILNGQSSSGCIGGSAVDQQPCLSGITCVALWGAWSQWGQCSTTCDAGVQTRTRSCIINGQPTSGCSTGSAVDQRPCLSGTACIPVWNEWLSWSQCSATCDAGIQTRTRDCVLDNQPTSGCLGDSSVEQRPCLSGTACIAQWGDWSPWSDCSTTCDAGIRTRNRSCILNGQSVSGRCIGGSSLDQQSCQSGVSCTATWSIWSLWSQCSVTCDSGTQTRTRRCLLNGQPSSTCAGNNSVQQACTADSRCPNNDCPTLTVINGQALSNATAPFSIVQVQCPAGFEVDGLSGTTFIWHICVPDQLSSASEWAPKVRRCIATPPDAAWGEWGSWNNSLCGLSSACNPAANRFRFRECQINGQIVDRSLCPIVSVESVLELSICQCSPVTTLPRAPQWSEWSNYGGCTTTCGPGLQSRTRTCFLNNATSLLCPGDAMATRSCDNPLCGVWNQWSSWSSCSDCPIGRSLRTRSCDGGSDCFGNSTEWKFCGTACQDCAQIEVLSLSDGVYTIQPVGLRAPIQVYCSKGWIVVMRNERGSTVDFRRNWAAYRLGFGEKTGSFWLGNENLYQLTAAAKALGQTYKLQILLRNVLGRFKEASYNQFFVSSESSRYRLTVDQYSGDAGNFLNCATNSQSPIRSAKANGRMFSTYDMDNDLNESKSCSAKFHGIGWWFDNCGAAFLTLSKPFYYDCSNLKSGNAIYHWFCQSLLSQSCYKRDISDVEMRIRLP